SHSIQDEKESSSPKSVIISRVSKEKFDRNGKLKNATRTQDTVGAIMRFEAQLNMITIPKKICSIKNLEYALRRPIPMKSVFHFETHDMLG
ncbi:MAG: hypothetical protein J7M20_02185, partial [Deltaproteobacteria bacterium]|nr:hypothetical protein [Deltaproteobacteria bacterium]